MRKDDDILVPVVHSWKSIWRVLAVVVPVLLVLIAIVAWVSRWPRYEIAPGEIAARSVREIRCPREGNVYALAIHVSGEINGHATFVTPRGTFSLGPGRVDLETGGDYYEDKATLEYIPENVTEGQLVVKYKFRTI